MPEKQIHALAGFRPVIVSVEVTITVVADDRCSSGGRLYRRIVRLSEEAVDTTAQSQIAVKWCQWQAFFPIRSASATVVLTAAAPDIIHFP